MSNTFYILDFDRCLADTNALFDEFEKVVIEHTNIGRNDLRRVRSEVEAVGDSFDTATYVRSQLTANDQEDKWQEIADQFVESCSSKDMLNAGARDLISRLAQHDLAYGTVTYGEKIWQELKIKASGLDGIPYFITGQKNKGDLLQSWEIDKNEFRLPEELGGGVYEALVLVDDKAVSFDNFPSLPSRGYWVLNKQKALKSQLGEVPRNVQQVDSLGDLIIILNNYIDKT